MGREKDSSTYHRVKVRAYETLSIPREGDRLSVLTDYLIITLIILSVVAVMLETVESVDRRYHSLFDRFEAATIVIFTVEYLLRIWSSTIDSRYRGSIAGRIRFAFTFYALVDLVAILPFYLPLLVGVDLRFIRILRILRVFRLVKLARYTTAFSQMAQVFRERREHLMITLFSIVVLVVLVSGIMFLIEHEQQPQKFSSMPETMWWAVCTMTTVGYGDVYPVTALGKILGGIVSILGLCLFAVPAGIISSGFIELSVRRGDARKGNDMD